MIQTQDNYVGFLKGKKHNRPVSPGRVLLTIPVTHIFWLASPLKTESTNLRFTGCLHVHHVPNCYRAIIWIIKQPITVLNELCYSSWNLLVNKTFDLGIVIVCIGNFHNSCCSDEFGGTVMEG